MLIFILYIQKSSKISQDTSRNQLIIHIGEKKSVHSSDYLNSSLFCGWLKRKYAGVSFVTAQKVKKKSDGQTVKKNILTARDRDRP